MKSRSQVGFTLAGIQNYLLRKINIFWALNVRNRSIFRHNSIFASEKQLSVSYEQRSADAHVCLLGGIAGEIPIYTFNENPVFFREISYCCSCITELVA